MGVENSKLYLDTSRVVTYHLKAFWTALSYSEAFFLHIKLPSSWGQISKFFEVITFYHYRTDFFKELCDFIIGIIYNI